MAVSRIVSASNDQTSSWSDTIAEDNKSYSNSLELSPGVYRISCIQTSTVTVSFFDTNDDHIITVSTNNGTVDVNISTDTKNITYWMDTGSNVILNIEKLALKLPPASSGVVDTITSTGTYNQSGYGTVIVIGGGGGGGASYNNGPQGLLAAGGGPSGGVVYQALKFGPSTPVVIGSGGEGGRVGNNTSFDGTSGGSSSFGNIVAQGGNIGHGRNSPSTPVGPPGSGDGGTKTPAPTPAHPTNAGQASSPADPAIDGTTGGGGGWTSGIGGGSSVGVGGSAGGPEASRAATGYGAGGGAGGPAPTWRQSRGGPGSSGIVYVVRH